MKRNMKTRATIGYPKGDFHYFTSPAGEIRDRSGDVVGSYVMDAGTNTRVPRQNRSGIYETWVRHKIRGQLRDGRTFTGHLTYLPGVIGNTDEGEITISNARAPSFQRNADLMVWKDISGRMTVLVRKLTSSGWEVWQGKRGAIHETGQRLLAFNVPPDWGSRVAVSALTRGDQMFFRLLSKSIGTDASLERLKREKRSGLL